MFRANLTYWKNVVNENTAWGTTYKLIKNRIRLVIPDVRFYLATEYKKSN